MNTKTKKSLLSFAKYLLWTAIGAIVTTTAAHLGDFSIPVFVAPLIAAVLKAAATYAATETSESEPGK